MKKNYLVALSAILLVGITFSVVQIINAYVEPTEKDPGHSWQQLYNFPDYCTGNTFVRGFNTINGLECGTPSGGVEVVDTPSRGQTTDGFACTDISDIDNSCTASNVGAIRIWRNTVGACNRDSLCYCGFYDGVYEWICLISCP